MSDNVVTLRGKAEPNAELVAEVEGLLERVKRGDIQGLAYVAARRDHASITFFQASKGYWHDTGAAILKLHARFGQFMLEQQQIAEDME